MVFVESQLLAVFSKHLDTMRSIAGEPESQSSLLVVCDMYRQRCDDLKRNAEWLRTLLEYYDRYLYV